MQEKLILYTKAEDFKRLNFIYTSIHKAIGETGNVLDVGCGNGNVSIFLGQKGYNVKGIDISEDAIKIANKINPLKNVEFVVQDAEYYKNNDVRYKAIVCSEVLEHLNEPKKLLHKLYDILEDDGILVVTVPNGYGPREVLMTKPMQAIYKNDGFMKTSLFKVKSLLGYKGTTDQSAASAEFLEHVQFFSKSALKKLAKDSKFEIKTIKSANFIEGVFPYSLLTNRIMALQKLDCKVADILPNRLSSAFLTVWKKTV